MIKQESDGADLLRVARKKFFNTFIGDLRTIEEFFGHLWGLNSPTEACTANQLKWRDAWEEARNEILNNGNSQLRAMENEMSYYHITRKG